MLHVQFEDSELPGLQLALNRALNAWDPKDVPKFIWELDARVVARMNDLKGLTVLIELKQDVQVRIPGEQWMTAKAGSKVNYSSEKRETCVVHRFTIFHQPSSKICEYTCTAANNEVPPWL